jgi:broad specificity phosphatase PhoE
VTNITRFYQRQSRTALHVIASSLLLPCLAGLSEVSAAENAETHFTHTLYLVRHGAYDTEAKTDPEIGPGLTPLGIAHARLVAARLRGLPTHLDSMTSSTMTRARETAVIMHETLTDIPTKQTPLLSECTPPMANANVAQQGDPKEAAECRKRLDAVFNQYFVSASAAAQSDVLGRSAIASQTRRCTTLAASRGVITRPIGAHAINVDAKWKQFGNIGRFRGISHSTSQSKEAMRSGS